MKVKLNLLEGVKAPKYAKKGDAGFDFVAHSFKMLNGEDKYTHNLYEILENDYVHIQPLDRLLVGTGVFAEIPQGTEIQVRPRSGLAVKQGLSVLNSPGTIDSNYRGEIGVILVNLSPTHITIRKGDRIAQGVLSKCEEAEFEITTELSKTSRGSEGFGSTGK